MSYKSLNLLTAGVDLKRELERIELLRTIGCMTRSELVNWATRYLEANMDNEDQDLILLAGAWAGDLFEVDSIFESLLKKNGIYNVDLRNSLMDYLIDLKDKFDKKMISHSDLIGIFDRIGYGFPEFAGLNILFRNSEYALSIAEFEPLFEEEFSTIVDLMKNSENYQIFLQNYEKKFGPNRVPPMPGTNESKFASWIRRVFFHRKGD